MERCHLGDVAPNCSHWCTKVLYSYPVTSWCYTRRFIASSYSTRVSINTEGACFRNFDLNTNLQNAISDPNSDYNSDKLDFAVGILR